MPFVNLFEFAIMVAWINSCPSIFEGQKQCIYVCEGWFDYDEG